MNCFIFMYRKYNGIALWTEWDFDGTAENIISTGPTQSPVIGDQITWDIHTRQGVYFLNYEAKEELNLKFHFKVNEGKINFLVS